MFLPTGVIPGFLRIALEQPCDIFTTCRPFVLVTRGVETVELVVILVVGANFGHLEAVVELA